MSDSDFDVMRRALLRLDPETRHQVIEGMKVIRTLPVPVAVRILARAGLAAELARRPLLVTPGI